MQDIYNIFAALLKYLFITIIYVFIFAIIRMIYLDIKSMNLRKKRMAPKNCAYLELMNDRESLYFEVKEFYPLTSEVIVMGRGQDCNVKIDDLYLSSHHTKLWYDEEEWHIVDLDSTNGTYINGKRLKNEMILDNGDVIRLGQLEFLVVL